jgi:hypothetical protein
MTPIQNSHPSPNSTIQTLTLERNHLQDSFDRWNTTYIVALILTVLVVVLAGLSQFQTINRSRSLVAVQSKIERESDRLLRVELLDKDSRIAELNKKAGELNKTAGEALERAGRAESHLADANARASEANARAKEAEAKSEAFRLDIARANDSAKQAEARAAEANRTAENERLERLKLEAALAPRNLTAAQQTDLRLRLAPAKIKRFDIFIFGSTPEIVGLTEQIGNALKPDWNWQGWSVGGTMAIRGIVVLVEQGASQDVLDSASLIVNTLNAVGISAIADGRFKREDMPGTLTGPVWNAADAAPIRLYIGPKQ